MNLEAAVGLVEVQTFQGPKDPQSPHNYDLLLKPPFPNIEIVRWAPGMRNKQSIPMESMQHWYTKDNRRLYVLQRAATKYWPKKVAVEADVLFAVPNGLRKKYDSSTAGLLVALGDSGDFSPSTLVWHWGHAVTDLTGKDVNMAKEKSAFQQLKQDDLSSSLDQLVSLATGRRFDPLHKLPGFSSDSASASSEPEEVAEVAEVGKADKARKETVSQEKQEKQEKGQQGQRGKGMKGGKGWKRKNRWRSQKSTPRTSGRRWRTERKTREPQRPKKLKKAMSPVILVNWTGHNGGPTLTSIGKEWRSALMVFGKVPKVKPIRCGSRNRARRRSEAIAHENRRRAAKLSPYATGNCFNMFQSGFCYTLVMTNSSPWYRWPIYRWFSQL